MVNNSFSSSQIFNNRSIWTWVFTGQKGEEILKSEMYLVIKAIVKLGKKLKYLPEKGNGEV